MATAADPADPHPADPPADDRAQITALLYEYGVRLDADDLDGVAALFAEATFRSPA